MTFAEWCEKHQAHVVDPKWWSEQSPVYVSHEMDQSHVDLFHLPDYTVSTV